MTELFTFWFLVCSEYVFMFSDATTQLFALITCMFFDWQKKTNPFI